ncbi:MAG: hypothetical protein NTY19_23620 [Planctomycetota bacterium]|nr:hypothetical protein [Planctomycetota bacterium]
MNCVDLMLCELPHFSGWDRFVRLAYICHECEKTLRGEHKDLYYFPQMDYFYHKHGDDVFYRAFPIMEDGTIKIGGDDGERENVIQRHAIILDGTGDYEHIGDLTPSSKKFFESMRKQKREVSNTEVRVRFQ